LSAFLNPSANPWPGTIGLEKGLPTTVGPQAAVTEDGGDDVTISAINRNFPGRSGPGQLYLASPYTVAASALRGAIADPREVLA